MTRNDGDYRRHVEDQKKREEQPELEATLAAWLADVEFEEHDTTIGNYVSESSALADLLGMLEAEQEDEEEEDLKDLVKDMELDAETAATFREAIGKLKVVLEKTNEAFRSDHWPNYIGRAKFALLSKTKNAFPTFS